MIKIRVLITVFLFAVESLGPQSLSAETIIISPPPTLIDDSDLIAVGVFLPNEEDSIIKFKLSEDAIKGSLSKDVIIAIQSPDANFFPVSSLLLLTSNSKCVILARNSEDRFIYKISYLPAYIWPQGLSSSYAKKFNLHTVDASISYIKKHLEKK